MIACEVPGPEFTGVLVDHPHAMATVSASIADKLRTATRRRTDLTLGASVRLARLIVEMVDNYGHPLSAGSYVIMVDLTQTELGRLIGASETTVHRALRAWRTNGWIETKGRRLLVRDLPTLREIARPTAKKPGT